MIDWFKRMKWADVWSKIFNVEGYITIILAFLVLLGGIIGGIVVAAMGMALIGFIIFISCLVEAPILLFLSTFIFAFSNVLERNYLERVEEQEKAYEMDTPKAESAESKDLSVITSSEQEADVLKTKPLNSNKALLGKNVVLSDGNKGVIIDTDGDLLTIRLENGSIVTELAFNVQVL
jgi:hypothetical protein